MVNSEDEGVMDFVKMASNDAIKHLLSELIEFSMLPVMDKENRALLDKLYLMSINSRITELCESDGIPFDIGIDMSVKAKFDLEKLIKTYSKV